MEKEKIDVEKAKAKAKGFFGYIKHLVKDPVTNSAEAKARRKELLTFLCISLAIVVIPLVIGAILGKILPFEVVQVFTSIISIPVIIGVVGVLFSGILFLMLVKISMVIKMRECTGCKQQITLDGLVEYKVLRKWVDKEVSTQNNRTRVTETERALVELHCKCQNCGKEKVFNHEFRLARWNNGTLAYSYELERLVEGFFTGALIQ